MDSPLDIQRCVIDCAIFFLVSESPHFGLLELDGELLERLLHVVSLLELLHRNFHCEVALIYEFYQASFPLYFLKQWVEKLSVIILDESGCQASWCWKKFIVVAVGYISSANGSVVSIGQLSLEHSCLVESRQLSEGKVFLEPRNPVDSTQAATVIQHLVVESVHEVLCL